LFYYAKVRLYFKCVLSIIILVFTCIRWIYWIIIAFGGFANLQTASLVLFELPTFLFLVMFSCVIYFWADIQVRMTKVQAMGANQHSWYLYVFLFFQLCKAVCVIILLVVYYTINADVVTLPCVLSVPSAGGPKADVSLAYAVVIAFFGIITSIAGLVVGAKFQQVLDNLRTKKKAKQQRRKIQMYTAIIVGIIFSICFLVKSAVFVALCLVPDAIFPIIVFCLFEIVPTFALMFYIAPKKTPLNDASQFTSFGSTRSSRETGNTMKSTNQMVGGTGQLSAREG